MAEKVFTIVFSVSMTLALAWVTVTLFRGAREREQLNAAQWAREAKEQSSEQADQNTEPPTE